MPIPVQHQTSASRHDGTLGIHDDAVLPMDTMFQSSEISARTKLSMHFGLPCQWPSVMLCESLCLEGGRAKGPPHGLPGYMYHLVRSHTSG